MQERFWYTAYGIATALNQNFTAYTGTDFHRTRLFAAMDVDPATGLYYDDAAGTIRAWARLPRRTRVAADPNTYRYAGDNPVTQ